MLILQAGSVIFYNGVFRYHLSRAALMHDNGAVKVRILLQKPLEIAPGNYINLWIPAVSFGAFLQSHPFIVISWAPGEQHTIDLLIEPQRGLTRDLLYHAKKNRATNYLVLFSGPHRTSFAMDEYESILMVASGFGIATQLPYLKSLIYGYNSRRVQARRIHLVWQIRHKGKFPEAAFE
jgi:NAD(P)H-flavin reductase